MTNSLPELRSDEIVTGERIQAVAEITITTRERLAYHRSMPAVRVAVLPPDLSTTPEQRSLIDKARSIFVYTDMLDAFVANILPLLTRPVVLVTHNSDAGIDERYLGLLDSGLIKHWFAQNVFIAHPRLTPVPIGLANAQWPHGNTKALVRTANAHRNGIKEPGLYVNFNVGNNVSARAPILEALRGKSFAIMGRRVRRRDRLRETASRIFGGTYTARDRAISFGEYITDLARWRYCVSPPGNGLDCHRTWEALYLGVIPIVSASMPKLLDGLPHLVITDFERLTLEELETARESMPPASGLARLTQSYWRDAIESAAR